MNSLNVLYVLRKVFELVSSISFSLSHHLFLTFSKCVGVITSFTKIWYDVQPARKGKKNWIDFHYVFVVNVQKGIMNYDDDDFSKKRKIWLLLFHSLSFVLIFILFFFLLFVNILLIFILFLLLAVLLVIYLFLVEKLDDRRSFS